jgi:hypothetical protein
LFVLPFLLFALRLLLLLLLLLFPPTLLLSYRELFPDNDDTVGSLKIKPSD